MKYLYILAALLFFGFTNNALAQSYSIKPKTTIEKSVTDGTFEATIVVTNISPANLQIRWKPVFNSFSTSEWDYNVCDLNNCYIIIPDSTDNNIQYNDSGFFKFTAYALPQTGNISGTIKIYIYEIGNYDNGDTLTFTAHSTVGIEDIASNSRKLNIYPNPVNNSLNVNLNGLKATTASVYDLQGKLVKSVVLNGSILNDVNVSGLAEGNYLIRLTDTKGITVASKVFQKID